MLSPGTFLGLLWCRKNSSAAGNPAEQAWPESCRVVPIKLEPSRTALVDMVGLAHLVLPSGITRITRFLSSVAAWTIWKPDVRPGSFRGLL